MSLFLLGFCSDGGPAEGREREHGADCQSWSAALDPSSVWIRMPVATLTFRLSAASCWRALAISTLTRPVQARLMLVLSPVPSFPVSWRD